EAEARNIHINPISHAQKPKAGKNRDRIRKGTEKGFFHYFYLLVHICLLSAVVCIKLSIVPFPVQEIFAKVRKRDRLCCQSQLCYNIRVSSGRQRVKTSFLPKAAINTKEITYESQKSCWRSF